MRLFNAPPSRAKAGSTLAIPEWTSRPTDGDKGPAVGGRIHQRYRIGQASAVLASFDTVARLSAPAANFTDVADDPLYGDTRLTYIQSDLGQKTFRPLNARSVPANITGGLIRVWVKGLANANARLGTFNIRLYSAGTPATAGANYHQYAAAGDIRAGMPSGVGKWQSFTFPASSFVAVGTGADLTNIIFANIEIGRSSGATDVQCAIGNVELVPSAITKAKFVIGFDDMYPLTIAYASRVMSRYGMRAVLYPSTMIGLGQPGKLTGAMLKNLHDNLGWQVASQAFSTEANAGTGSIGAMTLDQRTAEMSKLRNMQNALGLTGGAHGSYFSNVGLGLADAMFRQHFRSMRGYIFGPIQPETFPWGDPMRIRAMGAGEFQWGNAADIYTTYWKNYVDAAIAQKGVGILIFHGGLDGLLSNWQPAFDALCAYLDANRATIDVVTIDDLENP